MGGIDIGIHRIVACMALVLFIVGHILATPQGALVGSRNPTLDNSSEILNFQQYGTPGENNGTYEIENGDVGTADIPTFHWDWEIRDNVPELKTFLIEQEQLQEMSSEIQQIIVDKYEPSDSYNGQRENATFLILCRNDDVFDLLQTLRLLQDRFNHHYNYDFTLLNDVPFTKDFMFLISTFIPRGRLNFGSIPPAHWSYPDHIDQERAMQARLQMDDIPYGGSDSYRHMCRYYSGFFYKHPMVRQYQYYWRIEPGVTFHCDLSYDLFKYMKTHDKKYAFAISLFEYLASIPTLWKSFKKYVNDNIHTLDNFSLQLLPLLQNDDIYESYNLCHFWTNFELADLSVFDNDQYNDFFTYLDNLGGFFYERWGDAPIHSMAVALFLNKSQIHWVNDLGYSHQPYSQCPQETQLYVDNKCTCDPDVDFSFNLLSCTSHFLKVINEDKDSG